MPASPSSPSAASRVSPIGRVLRDWRAVRGVSQLELAHRSGLSARHVSFIETGRARASRDSLVALAEALDVPLRERNRLLEAGGYANLYPRTPLSAAEMTHVREMLQFILDRHLPYGALVADRYWTVLMANRAAERTLPQFTDESLWATPPPNLLRLILHPLGLRQFIVNWDEVASTVIGRAHRELAGPGDDPVARSLLEEVNGYPGLPAVPAPRPTSTVKDLVMPVHLRKETVDIRIFSTIMTFGTPQDVTLQELRVETFLPADPESDGVLRAMTEA